MALYDDALFIFSAAGAAGQERKDASKLYNVKPAPVISSTTAQDLSTYTIANTDNNSLTVSGGVATFVGDGTNSDFTVLFKELVFENSKKYRVDITVDITTGELKLQDGNNSSGNIGNITASGKYALYFTSGGTDSNDRKLRIGRRNPNEAFNFTVSDVSVSEVNALPLDFDISRDANLDATRVGPTGLVEKGRENKAHYSNNFAVASSGGGWGHTGINSLSTGQDGYDGTTNATAVFADTASSNHQVFLGGGSGASAPNTVSITDVFTLSVHVKPNGYDHVILRTDRGNAKASFNISTGAVGTKGSECITSSMTDVGNGFYRCRATFAPGGTVSFIHIGMMEADDTTSFTGNTSKGYILQDAQWELGLVATSLIPTSGAAGTAGIKEDEPRFDYPLDGGPPSLLIEPQRENLILHSEYIGGSTWTDQSSGVTAVTNDAVSPEGVKNATKLVIANGDSAGAEWRLASTLSVTDEKLYTFSVFAKAAGFDQIQLDVQDTSFGNANVTADLTNGTITAGGGTTASSIEDYGDGWYRIILVGTCISTSNSAIIFRLHTGTTNGTGDGSKGIHVYGAQFEEGAFASSYIPTHGTAATRSADVLPELDLEGAGLTIGTSVTVLLDAIVFGGGHQISLLQLRTGTGSADRLLFFSGNSTAYGAHDVHVQQVESTSSGDGSGTFSPITKSSLTRGQSFRVIGRVDGTTLSMFANGAKISDRTVTSKDVFDKIALIRNGDVTNQSGHKNKTVAVWASALTDAQCIALTEL